MKPEQQNACNTIRNLSSGEAVEWLIENYSFESGNAGEAFVIMPHRSWLKPDQAKLADYFLRNLPHRSDRGYAAMLKFMSLPTFIQALVRHLPEDGRQRDLIKYHLQPILKSHPSGERHKLLVDEFLRSLSDHSAAPSSSGAT